MSPLVALALAYLVGSFPSAYLAGRLFRGIDLRQHGSGNLGATNVLRVMGWKIAAVVMVLDLAKGVLPVLLLPRIAPAPRPELWRIGYGVAAILGHVRPIWLLWRGGGKGVATAAGVFFGLAPLATLAALAVWVVVLYARGYVSLASLAAAVVLPIGVGVGQGLRSPVLGVSIVVAAFVFWTHRANIDRLRRGEEHRFGRKKGAAA